MGIIYLLENKTNGKTYVGQTIQSWNRRLATHLCGDLYIDRAIRKEGIDNFKITTVQCSEEYLKKWESMRQVEMETGIRRGDISRVCNGIRKSAGGLYWRYI